MSYSADEKIKLDGRYRPEPVIGGTPPDCEWIAVRYTRGGRYPDMVSLHMMNVFDTEAEAQARCDKLNERERQ